MNAHRLDSLPPDTRLAVCKLREWYMAREDHRQAELGRRTIGGVTYPNREQAVASAAKRRDLARYFVDINLRHLGCKWDDLNSIYVEVFGYEGIL
jgi:hypothetical protein